METYERVRLLRKKLKLSQEQFGGKLGVSRSVIANIETNVLARPEQKEPLFRLICETFNINYEWLTTGKDEMFNETCESAIEEVADEYHLGAFEKEILKIYLELPQDKRETLKEFAFSLVDTVLNNDSLYREYRQSYIDKNAQPYAARHGDTANMKELVDDFDQKNTKNGVDPNN